LNAYRRNIFVFYVTLAIVFFVSLLIGRYPQPGFLPINSILNDPMAGNLLINLRLPRVISAMLLGISLSLAGLVMQTAFQNPLVDPGFLGVSQGAAFGAAFAIIYLSSIHYTVQIFAIIFGMIGLGLSYWISSKVKFGGQILHLILAGMAVSALFSAGVGILKYVADPIQQLPEIVFWLLGGLWAVKWADLVYILPIILIGIGLIFIFRWRLNILTLNKEVAFSLGIDNEKETIIAILVSVVITALMISIAGIVSWIGLVVPNIARILAGADTAKSVPIAIALGGIFAIICDDLSRTLLAGEIPLSIFTALFGAVIFIILISYKKSSLTQ
jgi:iron complex transport system permease protein